MKNLLVILLVAMGSLAAYAAEREYLPLVEEGKTWHYKFWNDSIGKYDCSLTMKGDTLIEGKTYKKIFFSNNQVHDMQWPIAYMCEDNKVVTAKSNTAAVACLKVGVPYHDYREFNFVDDVKYDFNNFSAPDYSNPETKISAGHSYIMTSLEDNYDGVPRNVAEWAREDYQYQTDELKYWVIEGVGIEGKGVHLLKTNMLLLPFSTLGGHILGYLAYVTNAKGEVIYTGRTLRGTQSGVKDVQNTATVVGEEYYNVNGIKLTTPTSGIIIKLTRYSDGSTKATKFLNR